MQTRIARLALAIIPLALAAPAYSAPDVSDLALFGVNRTTGQLSRFDFAASKLTNIGAVKDLNSGASYTGIDGMAYIPGFHNIIAFWDDAAASSGRTRLLYINTATAKAALVGQDLGYGHVTGATSANVDQGGGLSAWTIYAVQQVAPDTTQVAFTISGDTVVPTTPYAAKLTVLGAAISYSGQYDLCVSTRAKVGSSTTDPFGSFDLALGGNVNDNKNPREYIFPNTIAANTPLSILGRSWSKKVSTSAGTKETDWQTYMTVDGSGIPTQQIRVLRNADAVPAITGFMNQSSIKDFVRDYIDTTTNTMVLDKNQAIYLFELGTTDMGSTAADFQDLVVLVTLAGSPTDLQAPTPNGGARTVTYTATLSKGTGSSTNNQVTFKTPSNALGTNSLYQTDRFVVKASNGTNAVSVTTTSAAGSATSSLNGMGSEVVDSLGFDIKIASISSGTYVFAISSQNVTQPLTQVLFKFANGAGVTSPATNTTYTAVRNGASSSPTPPSRLLRVDHKTGGYTQLMTLKKVYDDVASLDGKTFYATRNSSLYALDPVAQTETLLGSMSVNKVLGLEFAHSCIMGFETINNTLVPLSGSNGANLAAPQSLGSLTNLGDIIFMPVSKDPAKLPVAYD